MKRTMLCLSLLAASFATSTYAHETMKEWKHDKMESISHKLDLTKTQKEQITQLNTETRMHVKEVRTEMRALHEKIQTDFDSGDINEFKIDRFARDEGTLMGKIWKYRLMERWNISKLLTPEQKTKLHTLMQEHREKMKAKVKHQMMKNND